jgi:hypothetical protein
MWQVWWRGRLRDFFLSLVIYFLCLPAPPACFRSDDAEYSFQSAIYKKTQMKSVLNSTPEFLLPNSKSVFRTNPFQLSNIFL